jgi:hypothetical protein
VTVSLRVFFIVLALMAVSAAAKASELWDFIRVGKNFVKGPKWESRSGKALVEVTKGQINIRVSYSVDQMSDASDKLGYESIKISGTLASDNSIQATCVFLDTDASPVKLTGRYITRDELQIWGEKRKIVTQKEIVFSHPPNFEFFGFLRQDARDE